MSVSLFPASIVIGNSLEHVKSFCCPISSKIITTSSFWIVTLCPLNATLPPVAFSPLIVNVFNVGFLLSFPFGLSSILSLLPFPWLQAENNKTLKRVRHVISLDTPPHWQYYKVFSYYLPPMKKTKAQNYILILSHLINIFD